MESNLYYFSGIVILRENNFQTKVNGVFDISKKESVSNSQDFCLSNISFKNKSLFTCKILLKDKNLSKIFANVKNLEFIFDPENGCYIGRIFSYKSFDWNINNTDNQKEKMVEKTHLQGKS